jgi:Flp pilus assembly protein TadG
MGELNRPVSKPPHGANFCGTEGVQIVELAIVLPLLMVLLVGIFDFGNAFNLKQKLTSAARAGARFGSNSPTNDLSSGGTPNSILAIRNFVDDSLVAGAINDCGLLRTGGSQSSPQLLWTFTASGNGCSAPGLTLIIDRSNGIAVTVGGQAMQVISTHIQISYSYKWTFDNVIGLIAPGSTYPGVSQIVTDAYVPNLD